MSKTREIEVWVTKNIITEECPIPNIVLRHKYNEKGIKLNGIETLRATIQIDLPEKKIELTESELDEAIEAFFKMYRKDQYVTAQDIEHRCSRFKQKLFGGEA